MSEQEPLLVIYKTRKSYLIEYGCAAIIGLILFISVLQPGSFPQALKVPGFLLLLIIITYVEISRLAHRCKVSSSKLVIINGLIKQSKNHIFLSSITDIDTHQNYWQRLINYGHVYFKSASGQSTLELEDVNHPEEIIKDIEEIIEKYKN